MGERQAARFARQYEHIIIDTQARPTQEDLHALAEGCDMLVIPVTPDALSLDALFLILDALEDIGSRRFSVLLTIVPTRPSRDGEEARAKMEEVGVPVDVVHDLVGGVDQRVLVLGDQHRRVLLAGLVDRILDQLVQPRKLAGRRRRIDVERERPVVERYDHR